MSPKLQVSFWLPTAPVIEHSPAFGPPAIDQLMPALARVGRLSESATPVAVASPSLLTVSVKPTWFPATTLCASGVFLTLISGTLGCGGGTMVSVLQSGSLLPAVQLDLVTTTTFGSCVSPLPGNALLSFSVTLYLNVALPDAGIVWLLQASLLPPVTVAFGVESV